MCHSTLVETKSFETYSTRKNKLNIIYNTNEQVWQIGIEKPYINSFPGEVFFKDALTHTTLFPAAFIPFYFIVLAN